MSNRAGRDLAASVQHRLLDYAKAKQDTHQLVLVRYGVERLLYRLGLSEQASRFILKGAMLFVVWTGTAYRATKDLDLLAQESATTDELQSFFCSLCVMKVEDDGLLFLADSVQAAAIREDNLYQGVRVTLEARLGNARIPLQVDIGFGDVVTPRAVAADFPTLLDFPAPRLRMYSPATVVAEKLEAMVKLDLMNSRMKDFYDIWILAREFEFEGEVLSNAIRATFKRRQTELPARPPFALSVGFSTDVGKRQQWQAFVKRGKLRLPETSLATVVDAIRDFLMPPITAVAESKKFSAHWPKGGPVWRQSGQKITS